MARKYVDAMSYSTNIHKTSKLRPLKKFHRLATLMEDEGGEQEQGVQLVYCQKLVLLLVLLSSARTKRGCRQRVTLYRRRQEAHRQVDDAVATAIAAAPLLLRALVLPPLTYSLYSLPVLSCSCQPRVHAPVCRIVYNLPVLYRVSCCCASA
jgi:hypothetical protein